jgi:hypothetical protein
LLPNQYLQELNQENTEVQALLQLVSRQGLNTAAPKHNREGLFST